MSSLSKGEEPELFVPILMLENGELAVFLEVVWGSSERVRPHCLRVQSFLRSITTIKTEISHSSSHRGSSKQHSLRTFHQVQQWPEIDLPPQMYGWKIEIISVLPVHNVLAAAPEDVLKMIFCRCTKYCASAKCGCKTAMLNSFPACQNCQGNCLNRVPQFDSKYEEEQVDPLTDSLQGSYGENIGEKEDKNEDEDEGPPHPKRARN